MEEDLKIDGEQPNSAEVHPVATDLEDGTVEENHGSPLGKFKSADKLMSAYNELQSEFTRKCQKLSEAEKRLNEIETKESTTDSCDNENKFVWENNVSEFLSAHENAGKFMTEIAGELVSDETLQNSVDGLEKAYARVLEKKYKPESELADDKEFLEKYIYSNDKIKYKIIRDYVSTLQSSVNPVVISNSGFSRGVTQSDTPKSLEDAKKYVENMFR